MLRLSFGNMNPSLASKEGKLRKLRIHRAVTLSWRKPERKLAVKWAMFHPNPNDPFVKRTGGIPFWGWGFSIGKQFKDKKFDYCVLIAAKKDEAKPKHIFVIKCEEMTYESMGGPRRSGVYTKGSYYIEFSHNKDFYKNRDWNRNGPSPLENDLFKNSEKYEKRWHELKEKGTLKPKFSVQL
jgi:hypothetical protein